MKTTSVMKSNDEMTKEVESRQRIHDRLVAICYGHGCGTERPLTEDGKMACLRVGQMILRGASSFTPQQLGEPLGWDDERSYNAIEELWGMFTTQCVVLGDGTQVTINDRALNVVAARAYDSNGVQKSVTYHVSALSHVLGDWWADDGGL